MCLKRTITREDKLIPTVDQRLSADHHFFNDYFNSNSDVALGTNCARLIREGGGFYCILIIGIILKEEDIFLWCLGAALSSYYQNVNTI